MQCLPAASGGFNEQEDRFCRHRRRFRRDLASPPATYSVLIRGGTIYDGSGGTPYVGDVALKGDRIVYVGPHAPGRAAREVDATGKAVAPGFINMLSWSDESLIADGRGQGETAQGVTLEVMGEGNSMGPLDAGDEAAGVQRQDDIRYPDHLDHARRISRLPRSAASRPTSPRSSARPPCACMSSARTTSTRRRRSSQRMRALVRQAMEEGAMGVGSSLIYAPATFAETPELIALATEAGRCGGMYISHMRSEGDQLLEAIDELIEICAPVRRAGRNLPPEGGRPRELGQARRRDRPDRGGPRAGQRITADMYTYTAGATGLDAAMPTWVQAGGLEAWIARLKDPATARQGRSRRCAGPSEGLGELAAPPAPDKVLLVGFKNPTLKPLTGKTLAEVARDARQERPRRPAIDLVIEDGSRVGTVYFLMSEDNVEARSRPALGELRLGRGVMAPEGVFLKSSTPPPRLRQFRAACWANMCATRRLLTPARGRAPADLPARQQPRHPGPRHAEARLLTPTWWCSTPRRSRPRDLREAPPACDRRRDVFVNGVQVLTDGEHTGAKPGRVVRGPGWTGWPGRRRL